MSLRIVLDIRHIKDFGIGTYIRNLVRAFAKLDRENEYFLTSLRPEEPDLGELPPNFHLIHYPRPDTDYTDHIAYPLFTRRFHPHLHHFPLNRVPYFMRRPYVVTIHDLSSLLFGTTTGIRKSIWLYHFRRSLFRANRIIAVSRATKRDVENLLDIPGDRITQIYNAIDPVFMEHLQDRMDPQRWQRWESEKRLILARYQIQYPYLLYAGTIRPQKNLPRLVEAFAVARADLEAHPYYSDLRLIIIGDEISKYPELRQTVAKCRVEEYVRFLGFVPLKTMRALYESAAAFVFPSLYEGFGLPPLEAMACGTPVLTSNVSSLPEVVGDAALLVNPENVFDIAKGIRELLINEDLRQELIEAGYRQVQRFSWEDTACRVLKVYRSVLSGQ